MKKRPLMTPDEFRAIRLKLGLSQPGLAAVLGYNAGSRISEIETGITPVNRRTALLMMAFDTGWRPAAIAWPVQEETA